jgi:spectinomycin phosphotransferase
MLEKPDIPDERILTRLHEAYGLQVGQIRFLPLGADVNTAVYRAAGEDGAVFFVKLRKGGFDETGVALPHFLSRQGLRTIISPLETGGGELWAQMDPYVLTLYPFVEGQDGYQAALTGQQWQEFGSALGRVHALGLPPALAERIPRETFSPHWRELVRQFQRQCEQDSFTDPTARRLAAFIRDEKARISRMVERAGRLAEELREQAPSFVLCHGDVHAGNLLFEPGGALYLVDWDNPLVAPREKDLNLVGGCPTWKDEQETALFYQGYGPVELDLAALAYYRYERTIQDVAEFCNQILLTSGGEEDREQSYGYCTGLFLPGHELDIAMRTDEQVMGG